jgi:hypothetical protein
MGNAITSSKKSCDCLELREIKEKVIHNNDLATKHITKNLIGSRSYTNRLAQFCGVLAAIALQLLTME